jgi:hypothetical protein
MFNHLRPGLFLLLALPVARSVMSAVRRSVTTRRRFGLRLVSDDIRTASRKPSLRQNVIEPMSLL